LSSSIIELFDSVQNDTISISELNNIELAEKLPRNIRGTINLLKVGLVHAKAANLLKVPEDILESTFANSFLSEDVKS
jgi:hypothetical protein